MSNTIAASSVFANDTLVVRSITPRSQRSLCCNFIYNAETAENAEIFLIAITHLNKRNYAA